MIQSSLFIFKVLILLFSIRVDAQSTQPLVNHQILSSNITSSGQQHFYFNPSTSAGLTKRGLLTLTTTDNDHVPWTKRDPTTTFYLTLTSCSQPSPPPNYQGEIPSIDLYLSTVSSNTLPGPTHHQNNNTVDDTLPGRISWQGNNVPELWIGVAAPTLTAAWTGQWTYELAISTQQWMHPLDQRNDTMRLDDTDTTHALLTTDQVMPNVTVLITQGLPKELKYSYCAAKSYQVVGQAINTTTETQRGQQHFMVANLTQEQTYQAYMIQQQTAQITSLTIPLALQTKSDPRCRLIHGLDFCSDVAYSVPTDPTQDIWNITRAYDQQAQDLFAPFATALSQFNCNNTQYSLVRNCDDCYRDYKRWLCAVTIPRCTSSSSPSSTLVASRTVAAQSARNPWIDATYPSKDGWTELLPCVDLCYQVVQSCPPFLQFNCPEGDLAAQQYGYWKTIVNDSLALDVNHPTCNRVGMNVSLLVISAGSRLTASTFLLTGLLFVILVAIDTVH